MCRRARALSGPTPLAVLRSSQNRERRGFAIKKRNQLGEWGAMCGLDRRSSFIGIYATHRSKAQVGQHTSEAFRPRGKASLNRRRTEPCPDARGFLSKVDDSFRRTETERRAQGHIGDGGLSGRRLGETRQSRWTAGDSWSFRFLDPEAMPALPAPAGKVDQAKSKEASRGGPARDGERQKTVRDERLFPASCSETSVCVDSSFTSDSREGLAP